MKAMEYKVKPWIAKDRGIPRTFRAVTVRETPRAVYVYGHGTVGDLISCCKCGRPLTHPVSRLVGIGPECGRHGWDESILGPYGFTEAHAERLRQMVVETVVDTWLPKSCIVCTTITDEEITIPDASTRNEPGVGTPTSAPAQARGTETRPRNPGAGAAGQLALPLGAGRGSNDNSKEVTDGRNERSNHQESNGAGKAGGTSGRAAGAGTAAPATSVRPRTSAIARRFAEKVGDLIEIRFPFNTEDVARMRTLEGRMFVATPGDKHNSAALCLANVDMLRSWDFELDWGLLDWEQSVLHPVTPEEHGWEGALADMFHFQKEGVTWLLGHDGRGIIGDEMGLGKTVQALAFLTERADLRPALVVCPASLKMNWERETHRWMPKGTVVMVLGGREGVPRQIVPGAIHIINYDVLYDWSATIHAAGIKAVVIDESHYIKNPSAKRTKAIIGWHENVKDAEGVSHKVAHPGVCTGVKHVIALTGTPIVNRPVELYETIKLVAPGLFPKRWDFLMRYCGAKHGRFGWDFNGATNSVELHQRLTGADGCMLRRLKVDVLKDLPAKRRSVVPFELDNSEEYRRAEEDFEAWVADQDDEELRKSGTNALAQIERLKQLCLRGKLNAVTEWVEDFLESGEKLVLFCHHKTTVDALAAKFAEQATVVSGGTPNAARIDKVDRFQNDPTCRLFIGTLAAIEGLTLTAASNVAFVELWWTPGQHRQGEDRVHRIGQQESVTAWYLVAGGTVEERIAELLDKKQKVLDAVLDGKDTDDTALLKELLSSYGKTAV